MKFQFMSKYERRRVRRFYYAQKEGVVLISVSNFFFTIVRLGEKKVHITCNAQNTLTSMLYLDNINLKRRIKAKAILKLMIIKFILIFQQERN